MPEYPEYFLVHLHLIDPIMIIDPCLSAPAQMQRRSHMGLTPFHDLLQFFPVIYFLERDLFHRRAGNNKSIELLASDLTEFLIKLIQMTGRRILRFMSGHRNKYHIHLKRRIR